jgi:PAS domain S-box-containing protein
MSTGQIPVKPVLLNRKPLENGPVPPPVEGLRDEAVFTLDPAGRVSGWNRGAQALLGHAAEDIIGQHFSRFYTLEEMALKQPESELRLAAEKERHDAEGWRVRKDGSHFFARGTVTAVRDAAGKVFGFTKIIRDLTRRQELENTARESDELFHHAFDDAPIGMVLITTRGRFLKANRALCEMVGYSETELLGKDFQSITHPDDLEKNLSLIRATLAGKHAMYQMEKRYFHKNGETIFARLNASLIREPDGTPHYFITQIENISEIKKREAEREKLIVELRTALARVKTLTGLIPVCGWCKKVRSDQGYWQTVEQYMHEQTAATFTHGVCPDCATKFKDAIDGSTLPSLQRKS